MSVGLDIAAGIVGLITLADVVITRTYKTIKACNNASKESRDLLKHVQALLGVLKGVHSLADEAAAGSLESCIPAAEVLECQATLEALRDRLVVADPSSIRIPRLTKLKRTILWPLSADETRSTLEDLDQYVTVFDVSLSVDILNTVLVNTKQTTDIASTVERTAREVAEVRKSMNFVTSVLLQQERRSVLSFFRTLDAAELHAANMQARLSDTRPGIPPEPAFDNWLDGSISKLWIIGDKNVGKTALAGAFIETAMQRSRATSGLAYYYCPCSQERSAQFILASLAGQLAQQNEMCFELLYDAFNARLGQSLPSTNELAELLHECVSKFSRLLLIVDGLDWCQDLDELASILAALARRKHVSLLILSSFRSRPFQLFEDVRRLEIIECYAAATKESPIAGCKSSRFQSFLPPLVSSSAQVDQHYKDSFGWVTIR